MTDDTVLLALIHLSRSLGLPERELVVMGEGNTSARIDDNTFWVKASGTRLHQIDRDGFVAVQLDAVLAITQAKSRTDAEIRDMLMASLVDAANKKQPSVETMFHAILYAQTQAAFIGHTHPISVNAILCAKDAASWLDGRTTPEEVVYLGPESVFVPYVDPGLPLARALRQELNAYQDKWGEDPKVIYLQNHGVFALGESAAAVENTQIMADKAARIMQGTMAFGGPRFMSEKDVRRIHTRPDEAYRRKIANA